jgi:hypothetical protein
MVLVKLATLPLSVSRLFGECGRFNVSQPHRLPQIITEIALLFYFYYLPHFKFLFWIMKIVVECSRICDLTCNTKSFLL